MTFLCPHCKHPIVEANNEEQAKKGDLIIKSRLVFLNDDGNILCKCLNCKKLTALPLSFLKNKKDIVSKPLIDL